MKLEDVRRHYTSTKPAPPRSPVGDPRLDRWAAASRDFEVMLDGTLVRLPGRSFYVETLHEGADRHGRHSFADLAHVGGDQLALIAHDPELGHLDIERTVFLDTETTGLGLGTGTYAFLVGLGNFSDGRFCVRRYFLSSPSDEGAFLDGLASYLGEFSTVVTFNGKAFDWPILENRFVLHRREPPVKNPVHLDLLHPARRLWKKRLSSCALSSLETHVLGLAPRAGDVSGWEIPGLYFQYQRTASPALLEPVFQHNLLDVLSLASLMLHVEGVMASPLEYLVQEPIDLLSIGKTHESVGAAQLAARCYEEALRRGLPAEERRECLLRLSVLHRRRRSWDEARAAWERLVEEGGAGALFALVERAKYYEHVERDIMRALQCVQEALALANLSNALALHRETELQQLERRLSRLLNRAIRTRSWTKENSMVTGSAVC